MNENNDNSMLLAEVEFLEQGNSRLERENTRLLRRCRDLETKNVLLRQAVTRAMRLNGDSPPND
jgi:hypothetical protein